jgi:glycosyltransferase involved in cell wall biosynthesis
MTDKEPLLSIITVVLNDHKHIEQTILSVITQKEDSIEYLIIDGGSVDGTVDIIKKHMSSIDYWISEPDSGVFDAMNKGILHATGKCIGLLNSGDYYNSGTLGIVTQKIVCTQATHYVISGGIGKINAEEKCTRQYYLTHDRLSKRYITMPFFHPAMFVSSSVYTDYGCYDQIYKISADYEFALRLLNNNVNILIVPYLFTSMRMGGLSEKPSNFFVMLKDGYIIRRKYKGIAFCVFVAVREILSTLYLITLKR